MRLPVNILRAAAVAHTVPLNCVLVLAAAFLATPSASAQVRYPSNPQTQAECDGPTERWKAMWQREQDTARQYMAQRDAIKPPPGCFGNDHCRNNYYATSKRIHEEVGKHHNERDRIEREGRAADQACRATARAHEQQAEAHRRVAEENRKRIEQQQREMQARQQDAQREQQAAQQRQMAEQQQRQEQHQRQVAQQQRQEHAAQQQQQQQQAAQQHQLAEQQRQIATQQRNQQAYQAAQQLLASQLSALARDAERAQARQPRVIAELPAPAIDNRPRSFQTPEMQSRAAVAEAAEQARQVEEQRQGTVAVLKELATGQRSVSRLASAVNGKDAATSVFKTEMALGREAAAVGSHARHEALDAVFNRHGDRNAKIDDAVDNAKLINSVANNSRVSPMSPAIAQIGNDGLSATGSVINSAVGDFGRTFAPSNLDALNTSAPARSPPSAPPQSVASLDGLAANGDGAAAATCKPIHILVDAKPAKEGDKRRHEGIDYQCKNGQWERSK